jgi:hypothetical protein
MYFRIGSISASAPRASATDRDICCARAPAGETYATIDRPYTVERADVGDRRMNIPTDCPYAANPPLGLRDADSRVECCRPPRWGSRPFWEEQAVGLTRKILKTIEPDNERIEATLRGDAIASAADIWAEEPLCRSMRTENEVYRFTWHSSFHGNAVVRIGRQDDEITPRWVYRWYRTPNPDDARPLLPMTLTVGVGCRTR